jgi:thiol-disulfide isomerase/thioredoxin
MFPKKIIYSTLIVSFSLFIITTFASGAGAAITMPEFSLPSAVDGKIVKSKSFEGKAMLITFFATWCPP